MSQRTWTSLIKPLVALLIGIPLIHLSHKHADRQRFREDRAEERFFLPNPQATKALSMGQQTMVSDLFWIRTVLIFADFAWDCQNPSEMACQCGTYDANVRPILANLVYVWR